MAAGPASIYKLLQLCYKQCMQSYFMSVVRTSLPALLIPLLICSGCSLGMLDTWSMGRLSGHTDTSSGPEKIESSASNSRPSSSSDQQNPPKVETEANRSGSSSMVADSIQPRHVSTDLPGQSAPGPGFLSFTSADSAQSGLNDPSRRLVAGPSPDLTYHDAVLTEDVTWRGLVQVEGIVTVAPQATLSVEQGTVVRFGGKSDATGHGAYLLVYGRVVAKGLQEKPILFSSPFVQPSAGDWQGIVLLGSEKKNLLEHCRVEGAETGLDTSYSNIILKNVQFSRCLTGARFRDTIAITAGGGASGCIVGFHLLDSEAELHDLSISGNRQGVIVERSSLYLSGGTFTRNDLEALKITESRVRIDGGAFTANGTGLTFIAAQGSLTGARIWENADFGILLKDSRVKVVGAEILKNGGTGIIVTDGKGTAWGNAIVGNGEFDLVNKGAEEFMAMGNWWGTADLASIDKRIYDRHMDNGVGRVLYNPVLGGKPLSLHQ